MTWHTTCVVWVYSVAGDLGVVFVCLFLWFAVHSWRSVSWWDFTLFLYGAKGDNFCFMDKNALPTARPNGVGDDAPAIRVENLCKRYKRANELALDNVSLTVPRGSLFGLLGPNGAGKSTLINILAGLVIKSSGLVEIAGHSIDKSPRLARAHIGVVPQELNIDAFFTPRKLLDLIAGFYGLRPDKRRASDLLEVLGLGDKADVYPRTLSGGMRRRLMIAKAMVHNPPVLILDEPTAGVDIDLRRQLWDLVRDLNQAGVTIILTTHYLEEAETLCDTIAIIDYGKLVTCEPTEDLLGRLDNKVVRFDLAEPMASVPESLRHLGAELPDPRRLRFRYSASEGKVGEIFRAVSDLGVAYTDIHTREPNLEEVFLQLTHSALDSTPKG